MNTTFHSSLGHIRTTRTLDIETKSHYWLTVCAQDQAVVPLYSCVQCFVRVQNVNDNVPLTQSAVYYPSVPEASPPGVHVIRLVAEDRDRDPLQRLTYRIVSGNPEGFFALNSTSGLITTTARKLDRENQPEHILEVLVVDNGEPELSSTTRVVIAVQDINDHSPEFDQKVYKVQIPANAVIDQPLFQVSVCWCGYCVCGLFDAGVFVFVVLYTDRSSPLPTRALYLSMQTKNTVFVNASHRLSWAHYDVFYNICG